MKRKYSVKRIFAVMLSFVLLIGATACGNNGGQSEGGQDTIGQIESSSGKDSIAELDSEPVAEEPGAEEETESNILIAYFSRVGNMDFDNCSQKSCILLKMFFSFWSSLSSIAKVP